MRYFHLRIACVLSLRTVDFNGLRRKSIRMLLKTEKEVNLRAPR
jgi:hypothetical protein